MSPSEKNILNQQGPIGVESTCSRGYRSYGLNKQSWTDGRTDEQKRQV